MRLHCSTQDNVSVRSGDDVRMMSVPMSVLVQLAVMNLSPRRFTHQHMCIVRFVMPKLVAAHLNDLATNWIDSVIFSQLFRRKP